MAAPKIAGVTFPIQPVKAATAANLPTGKPGEWSYEPKFDGFRCIAFRSGGQVRLQSRQERSLTRYFPEIVTAVATLDVDAVLDGELVLWRKGKLDFGGLQQRLHPAGSRAAILARTLPASYVVFDVLAIGAVDLRPRSYTERRASLEDLLGRQLPHGLVLMPMSDDPAVAEQWLTNLWVPRTRSRHATCTYCVRDRRVDLGAGAGVQHWTVGGWRLWAAADAAIGVGGGCCSARPIWGQLSPVRDVGQRGVRSLW